MKEFRQRVVDALGHADRNVRDFALDYFANSFDPDPTLLDLVVATIERESWDEAFGGLDRLAKLVPSSWAVTWLLGEIRKGEETQVVLDKMLDCVLEAAPEILEPYAAEGLSDSGFPPDVTDALARRVDLSRRTPDELWAMLTVICEHALDAASGRIPKGSLRDANLLVSAMAPFPESIAPRVRAQLKSLRERGSTWADAMATRAAGRTGAHELTPLLFDAIAFADEDHVRDVCAALVRIGSPDVIEQIETRWPGWDWDARFDVRHILAGTPCEASAALALRIARAEEAEIKARGNLAGAYYDAALMTLSPIAIEPAKQFLLRAPWEFGTTVELLDTLSAASEILGVPFPEGDELREQHRREFEKTREQFARFIGQYQAPLPPAPRSEPTYPKEHPFLRTDPTVGRNDPCPCRSGKKFKKCCAIKVKP